MLYLTTQDMHHSVPLDFDIHGAQYHDMIFNQCIDILPYRYVLQIPKSYSKHAKCVGLCGLESVKMFYGPREGK